MPNFQIKLCEQLAWIAIEFSNVRRNLLNWRGEPLASLRLLNAVADAEQSVVEQSMLFSRVIARWTPSQNSRRDLALWVDRSTFADFTDFATLWAARTGGSVFDREIMRLVCNIDLARWIVMLGWAELEQLHGRAARDLEMREASVHALLILDQALRRVFLETAGRRPHAQAPWWPMPAPR
jgi:hypothetical protein